MKLWALAYAKIGWPVFPITGYKTPFKGSHGHLDATTDPATIEAWWTARPHANLAVALGDIVVIDADGPGGVERLRAIMTANGGAPRTAVAQTSRGLHFYFRAPVDAHIRTRNEPRGKSGDDGIDIKAHGGWTVLPPSVSAKSRFKYKWLSPLPLSELPKWLIPALVPEHHMANSAQNFKLGAIPEHLKNLQLQDINESTRSALRPEYTPSEHARLMSALSAIPLTCGYDQFLQIGMALKELNWERSDGTSIAFDMWDQWCARSEHHNHAGLESKWNSFKRSGVTIATVYHLAQRHGWNGGAPLPVGFDGAPPTLAPPAGRIDPPDQLNGHHALPQGLAVPFGGQQAIFWPDTDEKGRPRATCTNASVAIAALDIDCRKDLFHEKMLVGGHVIGQWAGDLSDDVVLMIRKVIRGRFGFDPKVENTRDACVQLCLEHQFDPVCDYLASLKWDGTPRLERWLTTYMSAADTELNRAIAKRTLVAAVRRARQPGIKFDEIVVFESPEGRGKSTAIEILAGKENFSDQSILSRSEKEQQEAMAGVWLYEIADLAGMHRADIDHVKAFASRTVDRARPAYGRFPIRRARRGILIATTNGDVYLKSTTGNRRFQPVPVGEVNLEGLWRDRDQLWAEAAMCEARGDTIGLPRKLWSAAGDEQDARTEADSWTELINNYLNMTDKTRDDVSVNDVLCANQFIQMRPDAVKQADAIKAGRVLHQLGFMRYQKRLPGGARVWRYRRDATRVSP